MCVLRVQHTSLGGRLTTGPSTRQKSWTLVSRLQYLLLLMIVVVVVVVVAVVVVVLFCLFVVVVVVA